MLKAAVDSGSEINVGLGKDRVSITPVTNQVHALLAFRENYKDALDRQVTESALKLKKVEGAVEATEAFVARVSHEMRNPLNGLIGNIQLLLSMSLSDEQWECTIDLESSAHYLLTIVQDILDYAKVKTNQQVKRHDVPFDLLDVVESAVTIHKGSAFLKGIRLGSHVPSSFSTQPRKLVGDPTRISQILNNLLSNAIKFTKEGHVVVTVEDLTPPEERDAFAHLTFSVSDTGVGISEENQRKLFTPFFQADPSGDTPLGTGLGLAIAKKFVEMLGGALGVTSVPGQGSSFHFTLRLPVDPSQDSRHPRFQPSCDVGDTRFLVVDDNNVLGSMTASALSGQGVASVLHVPTVPAAIGILSEWLSVPVLAASPSDAPAPFGVIVSESLAPSLLVFAASLPSVGTGIPVLVQAASKSALTALNPPPFVRLVYLPMPLRMRQLASTLGTAVCPCSDGAPPQPRRRAFGTTSKPDLPTTSSGPSEPTRRALVVDDSPINQKLLRRMLEGHGFEVTVLSDGELCVAHCLESRDSVDVILMDVSMPVMGGIEATTIIRALEQGQECNLSPWPRLKKFLTTSQDRIVPDLSAFPPIPILAITGFATMEDQQICLDAGMSGCISKPINKANLLSELDRVLTPSSSVPEPPPPSTTATE